MGVGLEKSRNTEEAGVAGAGWAGGRRANDREAGGRRDHGGHISHCRDSGSACESDAESPWCFERDDMI